MTDKWEILAVTKDGQEELGTFIALRLDDYSTYYNCVDFLQIQRGLYTGTGELGAFWIYKNDSKYARVFSVIPTMIHRGQVLEGNLFVTEGDLIEVKPEPVCSCGGWAVYGRQADIHADDIANTCDLRRKS